MLRKNFTSWRHSPAPQQATSKQSAEARTHGGPELTRSGHMADKERTHGGHTHTHTQQTGARGGHRAGKVWRRAKANTRRTTWRTYMADKVWRRCQSGLKADARRAHGGHIRTRFRGAAKADSTCMQGETRWTNGRHKADTWWRTQCEVAAKAESRRTQGGKWRKHGGQAPGTRPEHIAASLLFPKREPHSKLFGGKNYPFWLCLENKKTTKMPSVNFFNSTERERPQTPSLWHRVSPLYWPGTEPIDLLTAMQSLWNLWPLGDNAKLVTFVGHAPKQTPWRPQDVGVLFWSCEKSISDHWHHKTLLVSAGVEVVVLQFVALLMAPCAFKIY